MVERFRYGSPLPREEREKLRASGAAGSSSSSSSDFWWTRPDGDPPASSALPSSAPGLGNVAPAETPSGAGDDGALGASFSSFLSDASATSQAGRQAHYRYSGGGGGGGAGAGAAPADAA
jgi:hypothetical protein